MFISCVHNVCFMWIEHKQSSIPQINLKCDAVFLLFIEFHRENSSLGCQQLSLFIIARIVWLIWETYKCDGHIFKNPSGCRLRRCLPGSIKNRWPHWHETITQMWVICKYHFREKKYSWQREQTWISHLSAWQWEPITGIPHASSNLRQNGKR